MKNIFHSLAMCALLTVLQPSSFGADLADVKEAMVSIQWQRPAKAQAGVSTVSPPKVLFYSNRQIDPSAQPQYRPVRPGPTVARVVPQSGSSAQPSKATGFRFGNDGFVMTVLDKEARAAASSLRVRDAKAVYKAEIVAWDPGGDLAVLKLDDEAPNAEAVATGLTLADSDAAWGDTLRTVFEHRDSVLAVAAGIASTMPHYDPSLGTTVQETDIAVRPGSAGAPVLNGQNEVVAVIKAMRSANGTQGTGIAISRSVVDRLMMFVREGSTGALPKPLLGVALGKIDPVTDDAGIAVRVSGALVNKVLEGTAAEKAGLKEGDVVIAIGGIKTPRFEDAIGAVQQFMPDDEVKIRITRGGEEQTLKLRLEGRTDLEYSTTPGDMVIVYPKNVPSFVSEVLSNPTIQKEFTEQQRQTIAKALRAVETQHSISRPAAQFRVLAVPRNVNQTLDDLSKRIDELTKQLEELTKANQKLRKKSF